MKLAVVGLGKAGLPLAAVACVAGRDVIGIDVDADRVAAINAGDNPIPEEPGLGDILKEHGGQRITATTSYEDAAQEVDAYVVIVPLFIDDEKQPNFGHLDSAFSAIANVLKKGDLVVLETTVPPGTTETRIKEKLEESGLSVGEDFHLAYSPERIMTGYSISRYREFPKVVGGVTESCGKKAEELYSQFCTNVKQVKTARTAELVKVAEGVYRDVNIGLANELFKVCEQEGVDFWEMREHANHQFCDIHEPGSVGGHCIPVYPWFLINKNYDVPLMRDARMINDAMVEHYVKQLPESVKKVGVIGLSYRAGVKETAYTRSIPLMESLKAQGFDASLYDPMYTEEEIREQGFTPLAKDQFSTVDALIVMNAEKSVLDELKSFSGTIIDVKGILRGT